MPNSGGLLRYHEATRSATYSFLMALPLLVVYEVLIRLVNEGAEQRVRISSEMWLKWVLPYLEQGVSWGLAIIVVIVGITVAVVERRKRIPLSPRYGFFMVAESAVYAVALAIVVSMATRILVMASPPIEGGMLMNLALSIGAGLYEELLFRVIFVGSLFLLLQRMVPMLGRVGAYGVAAVVGAIVFSAIHYIGELGDPFTFASFLYRALFGLALNVVFLLRGFGIAAWTHALYDVMVMVVLPQ